MLNLSLSGLETSLWNSPRLSLAATAGSGTTSSGRPTPGSSWSLWTSGQTLQLPTNTSKGVTWDMVCWHFSSSTCRVWCSLQVRTTCVYPLLPSEFPTQVSHSGALCKKRSGTHLKEKRSPARDWGSTWPAFLYSHYSTPSYRFCCEYNQSLKRQKHVKKSIWITLIMSRGILLVGLLIRRRDNQPLKFMGHDLKQFKSMEGFLESGPQFTLQAYILLTGQRKDTNIDFKDITEDDAERLAILSFSTLMSYLSLVKTAYAVSFTNHLLSVPHNKFSGQCTGPWWQKKAAAIQEKLKMEV